MTTSAKDYILAEASKQLDEATTIADGAKSAGRSLTSEEREKVETLIADATEKKARAKEIDDNEALLANIEQMRGPLNSPASEAPASGVSSPGDAFIKSDAFQALHAGLKSGALGGKWTSGPVELPGFGAKATVTSTASPIVQEDFQGFGPSAAAATLRKLTVADLMAQGTTDSSTVKHQRRRRRRRGRHQAGVHHHVHRGRRGGPQDRHAAPRVGRDAGGRLPAPVVPGRAAPAVRAAHHRGPAPRR
jgi:hypothetical protein